MRGRCLPVSRVRSFSSLAASFLFWLRYTLSMWPTSHVITEAEGQAAILETGVWFLPESGVAFVVFRPFDVLWVFQDIAGLGHLCHTVLVVFRAFRLS